MGITRVQGVQVNSAGSVTTQAITCSAVTLGNLLVVAMATGNNATTLTGPARWTQATINQPAGASATIETALFYLVVGASDSGATSFTFTLGASHTAYVCLEEWHATSGWPASPLDVVAQGDTIATPVTATTIVSGTTATTAQAEELWVAALAYKNSAQAESSVTAGWTNDLEATLAANNTLTMLYKVASSTGTASCSYVIGSAQFWAGSVATFKDNVSVALSLTAHGVGTLAGAANYKTALALTVHGVGVLTLTPKYLLPMVPASSDTFAVRTVSTNTTGNWGTASDGELWTTYGSTGAGNNYAVASGEGTFNSTVTGLVIQRLGTQSGKDMEVVCRISPGTSTDTIGVFARISDSSHYYRLDFTGTSLQLGYKNGGSFTSVTSVSAGLTLTVGTFYWLKLRCFGTKFFAKVWQDGSGEPAAWKFIATDANVASGGYGVENNAHSATNTQFDSFTATGFDPLVGAGTATFTMVAKTALALTAYGVGTLTGTLSGGWSATFHGVGTLTGTASYKWLISKTFVGVGTLTATLKRTQFLSGTIHGAGTLAATLSYGVHLSKTIPGVGTLTGTLSFSKALAVTIHGAGTLTGVFSVFMMVTFTGRGRLLLALRIPSLPTYTVQISGVPIFIVAGTLLFTASVGRRGTATFTTYTTTAVHFQQYQTVSIFDNTNTLIFSGYVTIPKEQKYGWQASILTTITCIDQHWLADKRVLAASYINQSCGSIVMSIYNTILVQEGVTIGQVYDGLLPNTTLFPSTTLFPGGNVSNLPQAVFVYDTVSNALDALATAASSSGVLYYWMIDLNKQLWFVPYTTVTGPSIDGTALEMKNNPTTVQRGNPLYRNTQYILGGMALTPTQVETRTGDGVTRTWTMGYPLSSIPSVSIGGVPQTVAVKGSPTGASVYAAAFYWAQGDPVITQDTSQALITSPTTVVFTYVGQYPSVITSSNNAQVAYQASIDGSSGIVESVQVDNTLTNIINGLSEASQLLTRYAQQGITAIMTTQQAGFVPGQLITVNLPMHGLYNTSMLVESVLASDQTDAINIWYTITAIAGPVDTTWVQFFSKVLKQIAPSGSINIGATGTLQLLANFTASFTLTMSFTAVSYSCPLPSSGLHPATTLFPC